MKFIFTVGTFIATQKYQDKKTSEEILHIMYLFNSLLFYRINCVFYDF